MPRCFSKRSQSGTKPRAPPNPQSRGVQKICWKISAKKRSESVKVTCFHFAVPLTYIIYIYICIQYIIWFSNMVESSSLYQSPDARKRCRIQECFVRYGFQKQCHSSMREWLPGQEGNENNSSDKMMGAHCPHVWIFTKKIMFPGHAKVWTTTGSAHIFVGTIDKYEAIKRMISNSE